MSIQNNGPPIPFTNAVVACEIRHFGKRCLYDHVAAAIYKAIPTLPQYFSILIARTSNGNTCQAFREGIYLPKPRGDDPFARCVNEPKLIDPPSW